MTCIVIGSFFLFCLPIQTWRSGVTNIFLLFWLRHACKSLMSAIFYFHLVTSAPGMHPHHFYMYMGVVTTPPPPSHTPAQVLIQVLLREVGSWSLISSDLEPFTTHTGSWLFKKMMMELLGGFKLPWLFDIFGIRKINSLDHPHQLKFELSSWESIPLLTILTSKGQYLFCSWAIGTSGSCISSLSLVDFLLWGFGNFLSYTRRLWQPQRRWITILAGL